MDKLKKVVRSLLGAFLFLLVISFFLPQDWTVERTILIHAPSEQIYPKLASFKNGWVEWASFDFEQTDLQYSYSGPEEGVGATRSWVSKTVGDGHQVMTHADPQSGVRFEIQMTNGMRVQGSIQMQKTEEGTMVTWKDAGSIDYNPIFRWTGLMMDQMLGKNFEKSLATLKAHLE